MAIPSQDIVVCHRSDGSGTSYIFTDYLSKVSPAWATDPGKGTAVKWPTGLGGKGNEGVTALVQQTPGAIGYIELIYALNNKIPFAQLQNKAGNWVDCEPGGRDGGGGVVGGQHAGRLPRVDHERAGRGRVSDLVVHLAARLSEADQQGSWRADQEVPGLGADARDRAYAPALKYAPLPAAVVQKETAQIQQIQVP